MVLLTSAATAYAECAWVLWQNRETVQNHMTEFMTVTAAWIPSAAFESRKECESIEKGLFQLYPRPVTDGLTRDVYRGLPDTVALRGPKVK